MPAITRKQREAIKRVYDRTPLVNVLGKAHARLDDTNPLPPITYRQFRKLVLHGTDCLMVYWCGMWLGIESDGYVHS